MRFAITSDLHFGSPHCLLVSGNRQEGFVFGEKYERFREAVGKRLDFLILVGDVLDFSISSYEDAYACAKAFFDRIKKDGVVKEEGERAEFGAVIYIAGNHDADIWHVIQHERHVIKRIEGGNLPQGYEHSIAGIIDDRRTSPAYGFTLDKTRVRGQGKKKYGGMFLDDITTVPGQAGGETTFYFAYPNLYIVTDAGSVLVTHGQYLEVFWALGCEIATNLAYDDLGTPACYPSPQAVKPDVERTVEMNFPLSQLSCTGIGQAGVLTPVVRQFQDDVCCGRDERLKRYLDRMTDYIRSSSDSRLLRSTFGRLLMYIGKGQALSAISQIKKAQFDEQFMTDPAVQQRFQRFFEASLREIAHVVQAKRKEPGNECYTIPAPDHVIFGHTHLPIGWNDPNNPPLRPIFNRDLLLHNAGGWVAQDDKFHGADIFLYETGKGFSSVAIR